MKSNNVSMIKYWNARSQAIAMAAMRGDTGALQAIIRRSYPKYTRTCDDAAITAGNKKIGHTPNFSLPAYFACPGQAKKTCGNCHNKAFCYAFKDYRYPTVTACRFINWYLARNKPEDLKRQMVDFIDKYYAKHGHFYFRLHESGDFYSVEYLDLIISVANDCCGKVTFYTYSKSFDVLLKRADSIPDNLKILISEWDGLDVPPDLYKHFSSASVIMSPAECPKGAYLCPASGKKDDPMTCEKCGYMCAKGRNICFVYHN